MAKQYRYSLFEIDDDGQEFFKWYRKKYFRERLPLSIDSLNSLDMGHLRIIAKLFRKYDGESAREWEKPEYIRFISGCQQNKAELLAEDPMPFGELPPVDTAQGLFGAPFTSGTV
jgi:hypothetical protein